MHYKYKHHTHINLSPKPTISIFSYNLHIQYQDEVYKISHILSHHGTSFSAHGTTTIKQLEFLMKRKSNGSWRVAKASFCLPSNGAAPPGLLRLADAHGSVAAEESHARPPSATGTSQANLIPRTPTLSKCLTLGSLNKSNI